MADKKGTSLSITVSGEDWSRERAVSIGVTRSAPRPKVRIGGEDFIVEIEDSTVYLCHPRWSLVGAGQTLFAAEKDLRADISELVGVMSGVPRADLDQDAVELLEFVLRVG